MTSSTSTRSAFSGFSESCLSEAFSSELHNQSNTEELLEDCPKCAAMRLNTVVAEEALASLSGQFKNLQKELKKTEQISKINEEQAKYIDERRSKLEKLEAEHTSLYAEYENLRISHDSLKRQYDEIVATARRNQRLVDESLNYHETCKVAVENLMAEKKARQELLEKYLKSVEAAAKINDSLKQLEKKCVQLQSINEKLEPFKYHSPAMLRLLLEFGEIVENNGLMTKSLQKRLARYKNSDDLREYLLRKTRRITDLSEMIEESSDDDELAKGVEDLLLRIGSPPRLKSPKKSRKIRHTEKNNDHLANSMEEMLNIKTVDKVNLLRKQLESVEVLNVSIPSSQSNSNIHMKKMKTCERQLELIEKEKKEPLDADMEERKVTIEDDMNICTPSTSVPSLTKIMDRNSEEKQQLRDSERLSIWLSFAHLDPLLPNLSRPRFLDIGISELSKQHGSDDYLDNLFEPHSPSMSSRRTSINSIEGYIIAKNKTKFETSSEADRVLASEETSFLTESLSLPPILENSTNSSIAVSTASGTFEDSDSLCCVSNSITETTAIIHDAQPKTNKNVQSSIQSSKETMQQTIHEQQNPYLQGKSSESVQNIEVSDEIKKILSVETHIPIVRQMPRPIVVDSKCIGTFRSRRKRSGPNFQNEDENLGIRINSPKLPKIIITTSTDTKKGELRENQGSIMQWPGNAEAISRTAMFSKRKGLENEDLVRVPEDKVKRVLEIMKDKSAELLVIKKEKKSENFFGNPVLQKQPLQCSMKKKQSDRRTEVVLTQQENVPTKSDKIPGNPISNNTVKLSVSEKEARDFAVDEENSKKYGIPSATKSGHEVTNEKQSNPQFIAPSMHREIMLRNKLKNVEIVESSSKNLQIREPKKSAVIRNDGQMVSKARKQKLAEEGTRNTEDKWKDSDQTAVPFQELKTIENHPGKQLVGEDNENVSKSMSSNIELLGIELSDLDNDNNRLEIVIDDVGISSLNMGDVLGESYVLNDCNGSEKAKAATVATKKSISIVKSEMYKKMHKRLAVQTSCMKELGRVKVHKPVLEKVERKPNIMQRKRAAIMLPVGRNGLEKAKNVGLPAIQYNTVSIGSPSTKIIPGSDEAAVMCLFDQALSESNYNDKLLEIVQKFQIPAISAISCEKLAECCVKFISKLDVGNMWHSVVLAVRYWSEKQKDRCTVGKILELHQVASSKERNFIEVLHQLSGEENWKDIISFFLRKMIISIMKTHPASVAQHGLNIRCVLLCTRILLQDGSNNEILRSVTNLLQHLIKRDSSDRVVPMICYSVAIVPEIIDKLLLEENKQFEPIRRVMSMHLAARDELFTIFNKVIMSRLLSRSTYSTTCLQKVNVDSFRSWFAESINTIVMDISGLDLESMELSPKLSSAIMTCYALFSLATNRLVPNKETLVFPVLNDCIRVISNHFESDEKDLTSFKERNEMLADATELQPLSDYILIRTTLRLLLFGRLITSFVKSAECFILPQIANLTEKIHRFREFVRLKLEQGCGTAENRLLYFGLNDWLRVVKPCTKYLQTAFTMKEND
ncbi:Nuclear distribution protein nudE [Dirofilaria immitis]